MIAVALVLFALLSLAVHELGHYAVGRVLGYQCKLGTRWLCPVAKIGTDLQPGDIVGREALLCALGGPLASTGLLVNAVLLGYFVNVPLFIGMVVFTQLDMLVLACGLDYLHAFKAWRFARA